MTPLQEGLLGATIIGIAIYSEPLAIKIGYLDADRRRGSSTARPHPCGDLGHDVRARAGLRALHCLRDVKSIGDAFRGRFIYSDAVARQVGRGADGGQAPNPVKGRHERVVLAACGYRGLMMWRGWYVEAGWPSIPAALQHVHSALTVGCTATEGNWMTFWKSSDGSGCVPFCDARASHCCAPGA